MLRLQLPTYLLFITIIIIFGDNVIHAYKPVSKKKQWNFDLVFRFPPTNEIQLIGWMFLDNVFFLIPGFFGTWSNDGCHKYAIDSAGNQKGKSPIVNSNED